MDLTKRVALGAQCAKGGVFVCHVTARLGDAQAPLVIIVRVNGKRFS